MRPLHIVDMKTASLKNPRERKVSTKRDFNRNGTKKISIRKILVPIDFSEASLKTIDYAASVATRLGAELNLVHVFEPQSLFAGTKDNPIYIPDREVNLRARKHLRNVAECHELPLRPEHIHVRKGIPFAEICRLARETDVDLIIHSDQREYGSEASGSWEHS